MGQGQARADACHDRPPHGLGRPVWAGGPAGHASSPRTRPASGTGRTRPGPPDPRAALVDGPAVRPRGVRPQLLQKALALLPPHQAVVVALDTPRLGPWEVWLAGSVVAGRTRPIGWAVMPYPWPKGRCRATTIALIQRLQAAFPRGVRWSLGVDRGFPRAVFLAQWRHGGPGRSVRRRFSDWVTVAGVYAMVAVHWAAGRLVDGQRPAAARAAGGPTSPWCRAESL